jgi:hypothetical protein
MERCSFDRLHIDYAVDIADRMRECDKKEIWLAGHLKPLECLVSAYNQSTAVWLVNGRAEAVYGVTAHTILGSRGIPWMLATDVVQRVPRLFLRSSRICFATMMHDFDYLENYVLSENKTSVKWLKWLGFTIEPSEPYGVEKKLFNRFWWRK